MMKLLAAPFTFIFAMVGRQPWISAGICAALAVVSILLHWGDALAFFACAASSIVIWKNEHDHPEAMVEMGQGDAA